MTRKPPCQDCCIRTVELSGELVYDVTFTASARYSNDNDDGPCSCKVTPSIKEKEPEISANLVGGNDCEVPDLTAEAKEDFKNNRDKWENQATDPSNIKEEVKNWIADNCDFMCELSNRTITYGGDWTNSPHTKEFRIKISSRTREAEFCGKEFRGWLGGNNPNTSPL
jgi:hypothetical protein